MCFEFCKSFNSGLHGRIDACMMYLLVILFFSYMHELILLLEFKVAGVWLAAKTVEAKTSPLSGFVEQKAKFYIRAAICAKENAVNH